VHPAIVSVKLAPSDDYKVGHWTIEISGWALEVINEHGWREFNLS
jgi:hydrogenase maturation factor